MKKLIPFLGFLLITVFYYALSFDKISFGDCMVYSFYVERGDFVKTATSLDHFLYMNSLILFSKLTFMDTIVSIRLFNSLSAAGAVLIFYFALKEYFKNGLAVLGAIIMALSFTFWRTTSTIEVCSFNTIFLSLFLLYSIRFLKQKNAKDLNLASFILALSFWSHVQNIMLIPALVFLMCLAYRTYGSKAFISLIYFLIPALALFIPAILYDYDFIQVYASSNPHWIKGTFQKSILEYGKDVVVALAYLVYNLWYFLIPAAYSIFCRFKKITNHNIFYFFAFGVPFGFATFYNVSDNYVYFIGPYQIIILFAIDGIARWSKEKQNITKLAYVGALAFPLIYQMCFQVALLTPQGLAFHEKKEYKGGLNYYLKPWMNDNVGLLDVYLNKKPTTDEIPWMYYYSDEFIKCRIKKQPLEEIKKL